MSNNQSKESADVQRFVPPISLVILIEPRRVLCGSETEKVGDVDGEW